MGKEKYPELRRSKEVMRWYQDVCRGSATTGDVYLRRLGFFCQKVGKDPLQLTKMKDMPLVNLITDFVTQMERANKACGYINSNVKAIKSWQKRSMKALKHRSQPQFSLY